MKMNFLHECSLTSNVLALSNTLLATTDSNYLTSGCDDRTSIQKLAHIRKESQESEHLTVHKFS